LKLLSLKRLEFIYFPLIRPAATKAWNKSRLDERLDNAIKIKLSEFKLK
jgi:hypothetical protein